ncbi:nuclear export mediator factor Nemf-like [Dendronephthya gigantea]|uniref:nuclear export mediator factor Nemf-like n=1 Tax=Dendronephthya gigantea TaxID=151771 RepID=UPI00106A2305|nr:nuclear export mediator factor Nemf-like [Dendronephthya gigantea]
MKSRFTTIDICAVISDVKSFLGMRVNNIYDIDNKTYLIRLAKPDLKVVLLIESGLRFHSTEFEWPKNTFPSGFAMKMRKHISGKRLVNISMLGIDRILDFQFGSNEAAYHLIVELYDRGNIILADFEYTILSLLRTRTDSEDVRFAVRERYPLENARQYDGLMSAQNLRELLSQTKDGDVLKKILNPHLVFGPALLDHCLKQAGFVINAKIGKDVDIDKDIPKIMEALKNAEKHLEMTRNSPCKGYIIQKRENKANASMDGHDDLLTYQEFHPFLFEQHKDCPYLEFDFFNKAVDEFFSKIESQKLDTKALQQEKAVLKKLDNVKKDHEKRLDSLQKAQEEDKEKARLIEINLPLVDQAIKVVNSAIANQIDWAEISSIVKEAQGRGDRVAMAIKQLKLETNHISMLLKDEFDDDDDSGEDENDSTKKHKKSNALKIDIDLALTAYANARRFYTKKRQAATKEQRTVEASKKALKSAEKKTKETLKEVATTTSIRKARKVYWFEKFFWFISSENYLVIGGRDQQQNELIVKRHLKPGDVYVHADLHGATSIVIKNHTSDGVPPKTLNEAGCMAICYSNAWNDRIITSAWWVYHHQVSKTAPTGEYLTTGSFMIRGKKNYLPPSYLIMGFGFLFRLDETCVGKHKNERRIKIVEEDAVSETTSTSVEDSSLAEDVELDIGGDGDNSEDSDTEEPVDGEGDSRAEEDAQGKLGIDGEREYEEKGDDEEHKRDEDVDTVGEGDDEDVGISDDKEEYDSTEGSKKSTIEVENAQEDKDDSEDDDGVPSYPDTSIDFQYTSGGKFQLQRGTSTTSSQATEDFVDLGDGEVLDLRSLGKGSETRKQRLTAKQRRQMKKKGGDIDKNDVETLEEVSPGPGVKVTKPESDAGKSKSSPITQQSAAKRGKKSKLKKMKERYGDQDEEDRELMMQFLGSAGAPKESKRKKGKDSKGRKGSSQNRQGEQRMTRNTNKVNNTMKTTVNAVDKQSEVENKALPANTGQVLENFAGDLAEGLEQDGEQHETEVKLEENDEVDIEKEEVGLLDSLTGCPYIDDITFFAIPVCAPYAAVQNYKFKVKLTPGTGRRGRAARTALHSFIQSRDTTAREKDLLKSVKDADLSRYIPGKVKISAPNLQKSKK